MLRLALCDDHPEDLCALQKLVEAYQRARPGLELALYPYPSASGVLDAGVDFDVFLLDILMPGLDGIKLGRELRSRCPAAPILYLTSSRDFAVEAFHADALSYLVKPPAQAELFRALDRAVEQCRADHAAAIHVQVEGGIRRIRFREILCVETVGRRLCYHLPDGAVSAATRRLSFSCLWEAVRADGRFLLVRRGCFVNMDYIDFLGETELEAGGRRIPIAQDRRGAVRRAYFAYCRQRFSMRDASYG